MRASVTKVSIEILKDMCEIYVGTDIRLGHER